MSNVLAILNFSRIASLVEQDNPVVQEKFSAIKNRSEQTKLGLVKGIFQYVSGLEYVYETEKDIWSKPEETIKRQYGDCEDFLGLTSSLLYNIPVANYMLIFKGKNWPQFHIVNLVDVDNQAIFLDTTLRHPFGKIPNYNGNPLVYSLFSSKQPLSNPFLSITGIPLQNFLTNLNFHKLANLQLFE